MRFLSDNGIKAECERNVMPSLRLFGALPLHPDGVTATVKQSLMVVISSDKMGRGSDELQEIHQLL